MDTWNPSEVLKFINLKITTMPNLQVIRCTSKNKEITVQSYFKSEK